VVCSKFNYLTQEPILSGRNIGGPDGVQKGSGGGPEEVQWRVQMEGSSFCTDLPLWIGSTVFPVLMLDSFKKKTSYLCNLISKGIA